MVCEHWRMWNSTGYCDRLKCAVVYKDMGCFNGGFDENGAECRYFDPAVVAEDAEDLNDSEEDYDY